ncbi:DNA polymerase III subunit gamma/tau, partial [Rhodobacteraceae bacterium]|nr:DNA polymerase III subunit gamma/tau [Paracoccaceae bacterium]
AEMAVIRLTHVADLPSPDELVKKLQDTPPPPPSGSSTPAPSGAGAAPSGSIAATPPQQSVAPPTGNDGPVAAAPSTALAVAQEQEQALARYPSFEHVLELIRTNRDVKLLVEVETTLRLAAYQPGRIEFVPTEAAPRDLAQRLGSRLQGWTGNRWAVIVVNDGGGQTIAELRDAHEQSLRQTAQEHPLVQAVMKEFPNASITSIRTPDAIALPPVEDEWDPFEEE